MPIIVSSLRPMRQAGNFIDRSSVYSLQTIRKGFLHTRTVANILSPRSSKKDRWLCHAMPLVWSGDCFMNVEKVLLSPRLSWKGSILVKISSGPSHCVKSSTIIPPTVVSRSILFIRYSGTEKSTFFLVDKVQKKVRSSARDERASVKSQPQS